MVKLCLNYPIEVDELFPVMLHHPVFRDRYLVPKGGDITQSLIDIMTQEGMSYAKELYTDIIDNRVHDITELFMVINKPYSGFFFKLFKLYRIWKRIYKKWKISKR